MDGYANTKLSDLYDKYFENFLTLPLEEPLGVSFCYLKEKNISRIMILECYGIAYYDDELNEDEIIFKNINSLNTHGDDIYSQTITLIGLINQFIDGNELEYPKYVVDNISSECFNNLYRFNITGIIDNNDYYDESIPKSVKINLENDLWAKCEVINKKEIPKLIIECNVISNTSLNYLNGVNVRFNKSKLEIDDNNMIIDGLNDFIKTTNDIIGLNVTCGISNLLDDNIGTTDTNYNKDDSTENILTTITDSSEILSNSTLLETDEPKIDETPKFIYSYIDAGYCSEDSYIYNIYGNLTNNNNITIPEIKLEININNINYSTTCNLEKIQNSNVTHKFKCNCNFISHQYFKEFKIYPKTNFSNLNILNWKNEEIIIGNENICTKEIINPTNFSFYNVCDSNSHTFTFEIEMESTIKEGNIKNDSLILNISKPSFIDEIICTLIAKNLSSKIKLKCEINNLSQEKRITDGIFINGVRKRNIFDEYLITDNNEYIKILDLYGEKFKLLECPQNFEIIHCKELNKTERKCLECQKNYYLNENQSECLTCSQLNEGCSSCNNNGSCEECLEGFNKNGNKCIKKDEGCEKNKYGPDCKTCKEIDSNCEICSNSGFCLKCEKGFYLSGIDKDSKCIKCLSTCEECESIDKCTKCNDRLILNNGSCGSCLSYIDGCEKCSEINKCDKCYNNNLLNYKLNNSGLCEKQNGEKKEFQAKLNFERLDGYQNKDNIINFKTHFLLLNDILYNSKLYLAIILQKKNKTSGIRYRYLRQRGLDNDVTSIEKNITCDQYGDALGNINGGYLVNYKCSFEKDEDYEIKSIRIAKMEIKDNDDKIVQDFETENKEFGVNEIESLSLDEEYQDYSFNRMKIKDTSDVILKDQLTFNIIGDLDSQINGEKDYQISLKDKNQENINSICKFKTTGNNLDNQIISCSAEIDKEKTGYLSFENGMFASKNDNKDIIILNAVDDAIVVIPKKKSGLSAGAIVGIIIAGLVLIAGATFLIYKFMKRNKSHKNHQKKYKTNKGDGSKDFFRVNK